MSKLVHRWDSSYTFSEAELTTFAEVQKALAIPFQALPIEGSKGGASAAADENDVWAAELVAEHEFRVDDIPSEVLSLQQSLLDRYKLAQKLCHLVDQLEGRVSQLQESHEQVRSKSLVMDSLWDGLVSKQIATGQVLERLKDMMAPYLDYEYIHRALTENGVGSLDTFGKAVEHLRKLRATRHHLDASLYIQRYEATIVAAARVMANEITSELEALTKLSSGRLKDPSWAVLADINSEYLLTVSKVSDMWLGIVEATAGEEKELISIRSSIAARYFSMRSSLLYHFFTNYAAKKETGTTLSTQNYLVDLIKICIKCIAEERDVAVKFFSSTFPTYSPQFKRHIEGILLPILKEIRSTYEELSSSLGAPTRTQILELLRELRSSSPNDDQRRVLNLLNDFFK